MERLAASIDALAAEFDALTAGVGESVQAVADAERDRSAAGLAAAHAPDGIVAVAERSRDHLRQLIAEYRRFLTQVEQLEQVWLISEELKSVVRELRTKADPR